ncbi:MAG: multidrug transporter AcrB [Novosphingobium sp. 28-62-57]|uniref:efflux RND transporter permease subunit n=1 Tax=unclassified Novosphingobium TaxID=2644732 RepID=UPI000BCF8531|nr:MULTISPECIES: efflux RND transporter permease subunit [unclassified Novosphingobium]OYW48134.1 MAG: multidrug transporter AcrB [Novosphingobium sp. 12-63-9]OYZ08580.1 MAG: multidrug transporter AcrB [Novosphingobium sp. 28-62-57]OZA33879.1 MAG: multidrug transporter AcrB [Novosphingobium sp. 17-62-9]
MNLGISGKLTRATIQSPLTPLFLLAAMIVGLIATITIPREEEPQIKVPMVDIMVQAPGLSAPQAVELVAKPLETIVKSVDGVEHVYAQAQDNGVLVTARFLVGSDPEDAAIRIGDKIEANKHRIPVGIPAPQVTVRGINDVPIVVLTLTPKPGAAGQWNDQALAELAGKLRTEIAKVDDVGLTFITGGQRMALRVVPDPAKLALYRVPLGHVIEAVSQANRAFPAGTVREGGQAALVVAGQTLRDAQELSSLTVRSVGGAPVLLSDVARVEQAATQDQARSWRWAKGENGAWNMAPAVSLAVAKRAGANAVTVSEGVVARVEGLEGKLIPAGVEVSITRNYGESANEKANELIFHLALATVSIVVLIGFAIGWREAGVTAIVIPTTIMLTMFASNVMGFTINRVSLFALIFSIGILVDDAIVMIENIARHWGMKDERSRIDAAVEAVAEVGNPTIVATLTVVAALLPMLFVSGLMGPYMAPIPINASAAMIFSFFVAVIIAPWLMIRFAKKALAHGHDEHGGKLGALYRHWAVKVIATKQGAKRFLIGVGVATLVACSMFYFKAVTVKLLPFDNKSEVQLVADLPEGTSLEATARVLEQAAAVARSVPEVVSMEAYAGASAPFNFNGLVRHYFLRNQPEMGDLMVTLLPKEDRSRSSHEIAVVLRDKLKAVPLPAGGSLKVVETPPGPPVMATLLAEIYGPDEATRRKTAEQVEKIFKSVPYIVDVDNSFGQARPTLRLTPDRAKLDQYGLSQRQLFDSIGALMGAQVVGYAPRGADRDPLPIELALDQSQRTWSAAMAATPVAVTPTGQLIQLGELVTARMEPGSQAIYRRDGRGATMVTAELAGRYEAPIYGMLAVDEAIEAFDWKAQGLTKPAMILNGQPEDESTPSLLWDGEWEITWVTFRDMGAAFMAALLGIYVLVVGQFRSFTLPLVILTPVPLTLIGIVLGHMLFGAPFTATSMIGFIALAGIIVRNSILLVDFINHTRSPDKSLRDTLLEAGMIRFKPIVLTAAAAMIGASVILTDPIFQGLAISLLFGLASSTLLTVLVIPAIYIVLRDDDRPLTELRA